MFFRLNEYKLYDLYYMLGDKWYAYLVRIVYSAVKETTTEFTTQSFFSEREVIDLAI